MNVPVPKLTPEEYLIRERAADSKSEYVDGIVYAMVGGSPTHAAIIANLTIEVGMQLRGKPCQPFSSELKVWVSAVQSFFYPDLAVACEKPKYYGNDSLENPTLLVEVLSPSSERFDRTHKFDWYRTIPSFVQYVLVSQDEPRVEVLTKSPEGFWVFASYVGLGDVVRLSSIGVDAPMAAIYDRIEFPADATAVAQ